MTVTGNIPNLMRKAAKSIIVDTSGSVHKAVLAQAVAELSPVDVRGAPAGKGPKAKKDTMPKAKDTTAVKLWKPKTPPVWGHLCGTDTGDFCSAQSPQTCANRSPRGAWIYNLCPTTCCLQNPACHCSWKKPETPWKKPETPWKKPETPWKPKAETPWKKPEAKKDTMPTAKDTMPKAEDTMPKAAVNLWFGGRAHSDGNPSDYLDGKLFSMRPENIKTLACRKEGCTECTRKSLCWHGQGATGNDGNLALEVPSEAPGDQFYVADFWARCSNGSGEWKLCINRQGHKQTSESWGGHLTNGDIIIYVNGKRFDSFTESEMKTKDKKCVSFDSTKDSQLRMEFHRNNKALAASSNLYIEVIGVDASVDNCMAVKDCLKIFGDDSDTSFAFRNSNHKQLECIVATDDATRNAISDKCAPWTQCLSQQTGRKEDLEVFLRAAVATPTMAALMAPKLMPTLDEESSCVDPSIDDPESWNCDCMQSMERVCGKVDEVCFRGLMCKHPSICCSWKQTHCPASDHCGESAALDDRGMVTSNIDLDNSLDQTLSGKCSQ